MAERFVSVRDKYSGKPRILDGELGARYGEGRTIFVEHMSDLLAQDVPSELIEAVLGHCAQWPKNTYVLQTKNPSRFREFLRVLPRSAILGTTIETNREVGIVSRAPCPRSRVEAMIWLRHNTQHKLFVTVEPILAFDLADLVKWITEIRPDFLNIGADSKDRGLEEPTRTEVAALIDALRDQGIEVREKRNLDRLIA